MDQPVLSVLNLDHPYAVLLTLVPALINISVFVYVSFFLPKNKLNITFSLFVMFLALWQITEGIMHISASEATSLQWYHASGIPSIGVGVFQVLFALQLVGRDKKTPALVYYVFLFIPGLFFIMSIAAQLDGYRMYRSSLWNWVASPQSSVYTDLFYLWLSLLSVITLVIIILHVIKVWNDDIQRRQSLLLAVGISVPIIGGITAEVILPLGFGVASMPITTPLITTFSVAALIAIRRYGLLQYSPLDQWEEVLKTMNEGVVIGDKDRNIVYANEQFCQLLEYSCEELLGRNIATLTNDEHSSLLMENAYSERTNKLSSHYQIQMTKKGGDLVWLNVSGFPYLDKTGAVIGSTGLVTDVTELMKTQLELKRKNNDLNVFFYKTAHDFKTPIASMQGLLECYDKDDDIEELLHYVKMCVKNLSQIVSRVSQLSVIQQQKVITAPINCSEQLRRVLKEIESENENTQKVHIDVNIETDIVSELFLFNSILKNLLDNAIKYADINKPDAFASVSIREKNGMYELIVKDNGQGIQEDLQEKIFNMFYRGNDKSKGAGLGLYIVKSAVEKLNGSITVKSKLGEGSEFTVLLPVPAAK